MIHHINCSEVNLSSLIVMAPALFIFKEKQQEYYQVLGASDSQGSSTVFIEFMLEIIWNALADLLKHQNFRLTNTDRISHFKDRIGTELFSRQEYLLAFKELSSATASRDLKLAVDSGILKKNGDKNTARYRFKA